ncbi:MAG: hypothetical protein IT269_06625 [Saprospiraceae bacterium]|nr:hypothetical protein [Saprospiraceae bacterium]
MMSNQNHHSDPAKDWLRQTLGNGYQPDAPDDAWQRLEPNLPGKKERRPLVFWWFFAASGLTFALAMFGLLKTTKTQPFYHVLPQNSQPVAQVADGRDILSAQRNTRNKIPVNQPQSSDQVPLSKKVAPEIVTVASQIFRKSYTPTTLTFHENQLTPQTNTPALEIKDKSGFFESREKPTTGQIKTALDILPSRAFTPLVADKESQPLFQFSTTLPRAITARSQRFWFGIEAAPTIFFSNNTFMARHETAYFEVQTHAAYGWQAGVSMAFEPVKNWRIVLGLQYFRQSHMAQHSATLRLMDGICLNPQDPGLKEYEFNYALISGGGGKSDLTLRLQQQHTGSMMPMDEPFTLDMETVHHSAAWRMPLSLERRFVAGAWKGFVRGGATVDFLKKSKISVTHFSEVCQDLCFQEGRDPVIQVSTASTISMGWLAGAGIERSINRRAALRFEPFLVGKKYGLQTGLSIGLLFSN